MTEEFPDLTADEKAAGRARVRTLISLCERVRREGLPALDEREVYRGHPFLFRLGLKLTVEGRDPVLVENSLRNFVLADARGESPEAADLLRDWLSLTGIRVLRGERTIAELLAHLRELLRPDGMTPAMHRNGVNGSASMARLDEEFNSQIAELLRPDARPACSQAGKKRLLPLFVWMIGAANRRWISGYGFLKSQLSKKILPNYLVDALQSLLDGEEPLTAMAILREAPMSPEPSGRDLLERSLCDAWMRLFVKKTHPRLVFHVLAGYFGSDCYAGLRTALRKHGARKTRRVNSRIYQRNRPSPSE